MTDSDWKTLDKSLIIRLPPHRAPPVLLQRLPLYRRDTTFGMAVGSESTEMKPRKERKGSKSKHRSRNSIGSHGSIKDMGLQHKIIDKMFFCMDRNSRIGLFFSTGVVIEVLGLVSLVSTIMLLIKIGFPLQAVILLLLSVRVEIRNIYI